METPKTRKRKSKSDTKASRTLVYYKENFSNSEIGETIKTYLCVLCNKDLIGERVFNLTTHLRLQHPEEFHQNVAQSADHIKVKRLKFLQNCTEIVTINGRSFSHILDTGFINIAQSQLSEYSAAGCPLYINDIEHKELKNNIKTTAEKMRAMLKNEMKGRLVSMMIDIGTRNGVSFFGIAVQYMENGQHFCHTLGTLELKSRHTAANLIEVFKQLLCEYSLSMDQVVAITTDNGANVLKVVVDLKTAETAKHTESAAIVSPSGVLATILIDVDIDDEISKRFSDTEEAELEKLLNDDGFDDLMEEFLNFFSGNESLLHITGLRCAVHKIQLVVKMALKNIKQEDQNLIALCKKLAKLLRLIEVQEKLKNGNICAKKIRLDVVTRWSSTYRLVNGHSHFTLILNEIHYHFYF